MIKTICALALLLVGCEVDPPTNCWEGSYSCCVDRTILGGCEAWGCRGNGTLCALGRNPLLEDDGGFGGGSADFGFGGGVVDAAPVGDASCEPQDASSDAVCEDPDLGLDLAPDQGVQGLQEPADHQMRR